MIDIGTYNKLKIVRSTLQGLYLEDEEEQEVLLPNKYCPESFELEDSIEVFVYLDHEERPVATTITPGIILNTFAFLQVTAVTKVGAFLDWGLEKELLVPFREQRQPMEEGRWYIVLLLHDDKTGRLYATNRIDKHLQQDPVTVNTGDEVDLLIYRKTDLGYEVIINDLHKGLLYHNELFEELHIGDRKTGYVKHVRADQKIDVSLQASGYENVIDPHCEKICAVLEKNQGKLNLSDKSSPEDIYQAFGMSKKAFKKAIGLLYKERKLIIEKDQILLT